MEKILFTKGERLLHHLILHSYDTPEAIGLFNGMTGIMLVIAHYARVHKKKCLESVSDFLLDKIINSITNADSIYFGNGLAGIGWSIEYLVQNNYMKGCGVDLTSEIDKQIMQTNIKRITDNGIENGIVGLFHYLIAHIQGAMQQGKKAFDLQYLEDWHEVLSHKQELYPQQKQWKLMHETYINALQGSNTYKLDLKQFIIPTQYPPMILLGLQKGLAGYLELQIQSN